MTRFHVLAIGLCLTAPVQAGEQPCKVSERTQDGARQIVLENGYVAVVVQPESGGQIVGLKSKSAGIEYVRPKLGLFEDRFWHVHRRKNPWTGPYQAEFVRRDAGAIVLRLSREADGDWKHHAIEKTLTLTADSPRLQISYAYKVHENLLNPSVITPWVAGGFAVPGEENKIFLPLKEGVKALDYNPASPPFHQEFFYDVPRGWLAVAGRKSKSGLGVTLDAARLMCYYLWFGNNQNTIEWLYHSATVENGEAATFQHEVLPFRGLSAVAGVGGGVAVQLDVPSELKVGQEHKIAATLYNAVKGELTVKVFCEKLPGRLAQTTATRQLSIPVDETGSFQFAWKPDAAGVYAVRGEVYRGADKVLDFELPATVGDAAEPYTLPLLTKRLGNPKERFGLKGDLLKVEDVPQIVMKDDFVTPHVPWARPYYRGPLRVFFITDQAQGRDIIELKQRFEIDPIVPASIINKRQFVGDYTRKITVEMAHADLTERLKQGEFDVIVVGGGSQVWTAEHWKLLREQVEKGTGLVWISARAPEPLQDLLPVQVPDKSKQARVRWNDPALPSHYITGAMPLSFLPETMMAAGTLAPKSQVLVSGTIAKQQYPLIAVREGKARVVQMNYLSSFGGYGGAYSGITPYDLGAVREPYPYWEYWYALIGRAILWAGKADAAVQVKVGDIAVRMSDGPAQASFSVTLEGDLRKIPGPVVEVVVRDKYAVERYRATLPWTGQKLLFTTKAGLGAGRNFVDVRVLAQNKVVTCANAGFSNDANPRLTAVKLTRAGEAEVFLPGSTVDGSIECGQLIAGCHVEAELYDGLDRLLARQSGAAGDAVKLALTVVRPLHPGGRLVVKLVRNGVVLDEDRRFLTVLPERFAGQTWDDFRGIVWGSMGAFQKSWIGRWKGDHLRELGYDTHHIALNTSPFDATWALRSGLQPIVLGVTRTGHIDENDAKVRAEYLKTGDKHVLVRTPSLSDPEYRNSAKEKSVGAAEKLASFKPLAYNFGDEVAYAPQGLDYDFAPVALADFRRWLRTQYSSLADLNQEWSSDFKSWDEVTPSDAREVVQNGHFARWADLRLFACASVAEFHQMLVDDMRKADPKAFYGLSGTQVPYSHNAMDWAQIGPVFTYHSNYGGQGELPFLHVDLTPGCKLAQWTGYGREGPDVRSGTWWRFLSGQAGLSFYDQFGIFNPDLTVSRSAREIAEASRDLRHGLGKLLMNSTWAKDRVAVYYSMPSILASTVTGRGEPKEERYGWLWALLDCGLQPKYVSYIDVRKNGLSRADFDVLVLPVAYALSPEETAAIREFVRDGGTVLADALPGVLNGHCRRLDAGGLDDVFGVQHTAGSLAENPGGELKVAGTALDLTLGAWGDGTKLATDRVRVTTGKALGQLGDTPAFIVNSFGKGKACYLNIIMSKYYQVRGGEYEATLRERLRTVFSWAGARAVVPVMRPDGGPIQKLTAFRYTSGVSTFVGCVLDDARSQPARITFEKPGHLFDVRAGKYLGQGREFDVDLPGKDTLALMLLPYRPTDVDVKTSMAPADDIATVALAIATPQPAGLHVFRLEVAGPDGKARPELAQNVLAPRGLGSAEIPFALNDPAGQYVVTIRDVATGLTDRSVLERRP